MTWPWHLIDLTPTESAARRVLLDRYGRYAQLSPIIPILIYNLYRLAKWIYWERQKAKGQYSQVPTSPSLKKHRQSQSGVLASYWRRAVWWLEGESSLGGERKFWVTAVLWTGWLLFLSVFQTGDDYMHFTKRIGHIAISQFPLHYMLSMKSQHSPLSLAFSTTHEQLNPYHRFLGRILHMLTLIHVLFYLNMFIQKSMLATALIKPAVILGLLAIFMLSVLSSTALAQVRRWNYRVFFITHLIIGISILPLLFFHAEHLRTYAAESLILFIYDIIARKIDTIQAYTTITSIPNTDLLKITVPVPSKKLRRFQEASGQHIYLSIPPESVAKEHASVIHDMLFNPFTIASVSSSPPSATLVLRSLSGPTTTALRHLTKLPKAYPPLNIEGPYGASRHFPSFAAEFDRVLLVAGGIGATFILPVYERIKEMVLQEAMGPSQVHLVWCMRDAAEAGWVEDRSGGVSPVEEGFPGTSTSNDRGKGVSRDNDNENGLGTGSGSGNGGAGSRGTPSPTAKGFAKSLHHHPQHSTSRSSQPTSQRLFSAPEDSNVKIFITGKSNQGYGNQYMGSGNEGAELEELNSRARNGGDEEETFNKVERSRPDLARIVDGIFSYGSEERVAVLVCGPSGMAQELRSHVGRWVGRGREVWFWDEAFGW